jgi:hypothetical protein
MDFEVRKKHTCSDKTTKKTIRPNRAFLFFLLIITISFSANDSGDWVLRKNKNGIAIYTRYEEGFSIKELKLVDTVQSSLSGVVGQLLDTKNYTAWVYHCSESKTLKLINDQEEYDYEVISVPWPFNNRDLISDSKISQDSLTKTVTINTVAAPTYIPEVEGVVRIKQFNSVYILTKLAAGKIRIDYTVYTDPGGNIPVWLINANIVSGPYNTFYAMNERLPQYQSASFLFIKE